MAVSRISIHAPHTGRDPKHFMLTEIAKEFQSTRPIRGATLARLVLDTDTAKFQSTRPIRGATTKNANCAADKQFQSTRPIRGATASPGGIPGAGTISIHAPHTGRDAQLTRPDKSGG